MSGGKWCLIKIFPNSAPSSVQQISWDMLSTSTISIIYIKMIKFEIVSRGQLSISSPVSGYFNYTQRHVLLSERCCESAKEFSEKCISLINKIPEAKSFSLSKSCLINSEESWDVRKKCEWFVQYFSRKFALQLCNKLSGFHQRNVVSFKKKLGNYKIFLWMIFQILMQLSNFHEIYFQY